ncbi:MAG: N-acetylglucosamine kinase [Flavobacteriaceae bacterium]|nr:MAG: N-acetylglucosamine kinase [Flavobacteriaceae bacterium]
MILIADGGSTKADWILLNLEGEQLFKTRTEGLNPAVLSDDELVRRIQSNDTLATYKGDVEKIFFYGAGCGTDKPTAALKSIFESFFINASDVIVKEDTYAAAYAATTEPGIVCILGTGSNSCFFDGKDVHMKLPSLGYVLMDEASGNHIGKKLIRDYFYKKMPETIAKQFEEQYDVDADVIKANIYKKENPNTYLATFAEFILANERTEYANLVLRKVILEFFKNRILTFEEYKTTPVHFVGSIAYFSSDIIREIAAELGVTIGKIIRRPIDGLLDYHKGLLKNDSKLV